ncbi:hypothetical protein E2F43_10505 [Seongchinamella unica]|uniref:YtfJ family protein n=1 Tax=Seongchinamella unica TaxID=2547392 RepID=A0A4R5LSR4_9GAMM|nr:YtfJ family protein [Seongchinamella unica]TDG13920.1 hypothetical protein E2F43_10505 [Seongchinamella unica]
MRYTASLLLLALVQLSPVQASSSGAGLPPLTITRLGELVLAGDEFDYRHWHSGRAVDKVHVLQYFPGTLSASKTFEPFTDLLQEKYQPDSYHVTTIINLDAALWGTGGFVVSEVKKNKRRFPGATMVLDKTGDAVSAWELGEQGVGLFILDAQGKVHFQVHDAMSEDVQAQAAAVVSSLISSQRGQAPPAR